jgi:hypothetical protein
MRPLLATIALLFAGCATQHPPTVLAFKRVWPEWQDADSFQSLYENHTGRELTGKWDVMRSHPEDRAGLYFLARIENPGGELRGGTLVVRVITQKSPGVKSYDFPADVPGGSHLFELGLTGKDWTGPRVAPVAWEVELDDADGRVLIRKTSYLWEKPDV